MNIILRELRANAKSVIIWIGCIGLLFLMASTEFSSMQGNPEVEKLMSSLPEAMVKALSLDVVRFDKVEGYYSYVAQYVMIAAAIFASLSGAKILSKEIHKKTAETVFALPVSRRHIVGMKALVAMVNCLIMAAVIFALSMAIFGGFDSEPGFAGRTFTFSSFIFLIQLLYIAVGLTISMLITRHKRAGTFVAAVALATYMVSLIANMGETAKFLRFFTPFEYFNAIDVMHGHEIGLFGFIAVPVLIVLLGTTSFTLLEKKDIYT